MSSAQLWLARTAVVSTTPLCPATSQKSPLSTQIANHSAWNALSTAKISLDFCILLAPLASFMKWPWESDQNLLWIAVFTKMSLGCNSLRSLILTSWTITMTMLQCSLTGRSRKWPQYGSANESLSKMVIIQSMMSQDGIGTVNRLLSLVVEL